MLDRSRRVILLIDYDNLQICASRDTPGRELVLEPVVQLAQRYGTVIFARAYAEWNLSTERLAVYKAGIEPAFAPVLRTESDRAGKSLADTVMVAEGMDMLWTLAPDVLVLATSDKDLIPLVRVAKQRGARVVVLGSDFTAIPLREMADEHVTYKQLIIEAGRSADGPSGRPAGAVAEAPRRPRSREREREPRAATAAQPPTAPLPVVPSTPPGEPVAPVPTTDGETPLAGRRRRRRGSRRRGERALPAPGEASTPAEAHVEAGEREESTEPFESALPAMAGAVGAESAGMAEEPAPAESAAPPGPATGGVAEDRPPSESSAAPGGPVDVPVIAPATEPEPAAKAAQPPNGAEPAPAPRTRARRVASAARGRSRPAGR